MRHFEPTGTRFLDMASGREMILVEQPVHAAGWLCYRHPDGQWVTIRKATEADRESIFAASPAPPHPSA